MEENDISQDIYALARNEPESIRLNQQHQVAIETLNYVIHPRILTRLPRSARVADVGTGTGAWALHASYILPDKAEIVGYDISEAQFPKQSPPNVKFITSDAKLAFPVRDHGTFDLVHVRALTFAMEPRDWSIVMRNLIEILKPGGAIQWTEADLSRMCCLRANPQPCKYDALPLLLERFEQSLGEQSANGWKKLIETSRQSGLLDGEYDIVSSDRVPTVRKLSVQSYLEMLLGWAGKTQAWPPEELDRLRKEANNDIENGAYIRASTVTFIGFKSVDDTADTS